MSLGFLNRALARGQSNRIAIIQGNIDQARKWDPAFQISTTKKYVELTRKANAQQPDLVVWPENAIVDKHVVIPRNRQIGVDGERDAEEFSISPSGVVAIGKGHKVKYA